MLLKSCIQYRLHHLSRWDHVLTIQILRWYLLREVLLRIHKNKNSSLLLCFIGSLFIIGHCVFPPGRNDFHLETSDVYSGYLWNIYLFFIIDNFLFLAGSCDGYTNITDTWRNYLFISSTFSDYPNDDAALVGNWLRFVGLGGDTLIPDCPAGPCGGTTYPIYFPFSYPKDESETASTGTAYANNGSCEAYSSEMSVVLCPGGFYIYKPSSHQSSSMGFVTCKE